MPTVLAAAIVWAIPATGAVVLGVTVATWIASAVMLMGTLAYSSSQKRKAERMAHAQFDAAQVDRLANVPATVAPRELVLGRTRKGGQVFFRQSVGQDKETFVICIALAAHEIDAVEKVCFNEVPIDLDGSNNVTTAPYGRYVTESVPASPSLNGGYQITAAVTALQFLPIAGSMKVLRRTLEPDSGASPQYQTSEAVFTLVGQTLTITGFDPAALYFAYYQHTAFYSQARVRWLLGSPGQTADARMQTLFPGVWTSAHRADGVAYLICEFDYNETAFPSGLPNVTALVRGAKIYDPRSGLTVFTENPALMMRHVLLHPQFGKRTSMTAAEDTRITAAANACEVAINYTGLEVVQTYRAATVIPFGATARDALDDLSQAMGGQWAYASGEIFMRAGAYQAPVLSLTDADLAVVQRSNDGGTSQSPITISTHRPRNDKINTVVARIWDQAAGYVQTPITPYKADSLIAADGAALVQEVTMPAVYSAVQAWHIAGIMMRDGRDPLTVTLPFKLRVYPVELFDGVTLTLARYGWVSKEFQVLGRNFSPEGFLQLTLKETAVSIYQYTAGFLPSGYASNSGLPRPWDISPPSIAAISSGESDLVVQSDGTIVNGVRVTLSALQDLSVTQGGSIEVQYVVVPDGAWRSVSVPGGDTSAIILGVNDGAWIFVRARARNAVAVSNWSAQVSHQVVGKTEPPPDMENLSISGSVLSWSLPRRVPDLAGYVFRFHYGSNLDWHSGVPLHNGVLTESPYDLLTRPGGVVTIMGKAIDTTGNVSTNSADIVMNLGDPPIANIIEQWDFAALGWPYSAADSSGWTIVSTFPTADALDSFYGTDDQTFFGAEIDSFYEASAYGQMVYVTTAVSISSALAGSIMTLSTTTQGVDLRIEYRLAGPGSLYGPDSAPFYDADADPFYGPPGGWQAWPGQLIAANDAYQFRVTIGAGVTRGILQAMVLTIDAPDMEESIADCAISAGGTTVPFTKPFTSIKVVQVQLQANGSGAETVEVNKTVPLAPVVRAFNSAHTAVSGATADIVVKGY